MQQCSKNNLCENKNKNMPCRETMPNRRKLIVSNDELTRNTGNDEVNLPPPQSDRLSQPANKGAAPDLQPSQKGTACGIMLC